MPVGARALVIALTLVANTCAPGPQSGSPGATLDQRTLEPSSTAPSLTTPAQSPTLTVAPTASSPVPVTRTIGGTAAAEGVPVAGVRIRGQLPYPPGQQPLPDVTAVTDARGAYTLTFPTWTAEALGGNSPIMILNFELPTGFVLVGVTKAAGSPGSLPNMAMLLQDELGVGPIDITLARGHVVEGKVISDTTGAAVAGVGVIALRPNSMLITGGAGDAFEFEATATTDAAGRYQLTVRSGTYVIYTPGPQDSQRQFWSDDAAVFQATPLRVERGLAGIDITLARTTPLFGLVRPGPTSEGEAGTRVAAYLAGGTACCRLVGRATTGYGGTFVMYLPQGIYRIVIDPPAGSPYAAQWWNRATGFATATDVTVGSDSVRLEVELVRVRP